MRFLIAAVILPMFLFFCNPDPADMHVEDLQKAEPQLFFAAVYYLPGGSSLFESPTSWFGEPPASFNERLSDREQQQILDRLGSSFSKMNKESKRRYIERFNLWTENYRKLDDMSERTSTEEVLAAAYETGHFNKLFQPLIETRNIPQEDFEPIEVVSMFASSENITLFYRMAQELSMLSPTEAEQQIADIREHLE